MKKVLVLVAAAVASFAVAAPSSLARDATTSPGYNFSISVYITDGGVTLSRSLAKRGWLAHFVVYNRGKKAHVLDIGGLKTKRIAPGAKGKVGAFLDTRGQYPIKVDNKMRGYFTVN